MLARAISPEQIQRAMRSSRHSIFCLVLLLVSGLPDDGLDGDDFDDIDPPGTVCSQPMYPFALRHRLKIFEQIAAGPNSCHQLDCPRLEGENQLESELTVDQPSDLTGTRALYLLMSLQR